MFINNKEFKDLEDILATDCSTAPQWLSEFISRLYEEASDRGLDSPDNDCLDFVLDMNPDVYRVAKR